MDEESFVTRRHKVAGFLVRAVANGWHSSLALESSPHSIIDALWFPPAWVHAFEPIALMPVEALGAFLDDLDMLLCGRHQTRP